MKNLYDYLVDNNNQCILKIKDDFLKIRLLEPNLILLHYKEKQYYIYEISNAKDKIEEYLEKDHKVEIRFCETCGKPIIAGYTVDSGWWYCCEDCLEETMNKDYGKEKWRRSKEEGENGGFYEYLNKDDEWEDTGIYYTEWY